MNCTETVGESRYVAAPIPPVDNKKKERPMAPVPDTPDQFKTRVDRCKRKLAPDIIDNAGREHAKYLVEALLDVAASKKEPVVIVTGVFDPGFYGDLVASFQKCVNAGVTIDVIVLDGSRLDSHPITKAISSPRLSVRTIDSMQDPETATAPHFVLVGDRRYRLERDHDHDIAVASFNDVQMGRWLKSIYAWLVERLTKNAA